MTDLRRFWELLASAAWCGALMAGSAAIDPVEALTIVPTFTSSVTGATNATTIENSIDAAIGTIDPLASNPGTVNIGYSACGGGGAPGCRGNFVGRATPSRSFDGGNEVKDAASKAEARMAAPVGTLTDYGIKSDANTVNLLGKGVAQTAIELIDQTRQLRVLANDQIAAASKTMEDGITAAAQAQAETTHAEAMADAATARRRSLLFGGVITALLIASGGLVTWLVASPIHGLTRAMQRVAAGDDTIEVGHAGRKDEIGRMAAALAMLQRAIREAFVRGQMIEQIPIGVMRVEAAGDHRITYLNPAARDLLGLVQSHLELPRAGPHEGPRDGLGDGLQGASLDIFDRYRDALRARLEAPDSLPYRDQRSVGDETLARTISEIRDRGNARAGLMVVWHRLTGQVRLTDQLERTVGKIAAAVGERAEAMTETARARHGGDRRRHAQPFRYRSVRSGDRQRQCRRRRGRAIGGIDRGDRPPGDGFS